MTGCVPNWSLWGGNSMGTTHTRHMYAPSFAPLRRVLAPRGGVLMSWEGVLASCRRGVGLWGMLGFKSDVCAFKRSVWALGQGVHDVRFFFHLIATVTIRCMQCHTDWNKDEQNACWKPYKRAIGNLQLHQQWCCIFWCSHCNISCHIYCIVRWVCNRQNLCLKILPEMTPFFSKLYSTYIGPHWNT